MTGAELLQELIEVEGLDGIDGLAAELRRTKTTPVAWAQRAVKAAMEAGLDAESELLSDLYEVVGNDIRLPWGAFGY